MGSATYAGPLNQLKLYSVVQKDQHMKNIYTLDRCTIRILQTPIIAAPKYSRKIGKVFYLHTNFVKLVTLQMLPR